MPYEKVRTCTYWYVRVCVQMEFCDTYRYVLIRTSTYQYVLVRMIWPDLVQVYSSRGQDTTQSQSRARIARNAPLEQCPVEGLGLLDTVTVTSHPQSAPDP